MLIPNNNEAEEKPVYFSVEFYEETEGDKFRILYELEIDLGAQSRFSLLKKNRLRFSIWKILFFYLFIFFW